MRKTLPISRFMKQEISFTRLTQISTPEILAHMKNPRLAEHMPLLTQDWDEETVDEFVKAKEAYWTRDGLGHWAFLHGGDYVGWGGFQKEGEEWDAGLVLKPGAFGLGARITRRAMEFAKSDERITSVTFLLPPSRKKLGALRKLGACPVGEVDYGGEKFLKYRLNIDAS